MKSFIAFLLVLIAVLVIAISSTSAQENPPCDWSDCVPPTAWVYQNASTYLPVESGCSTCEITMEWWQRDCGGQIQIAMGNVSYTGDCTQCVFWLYHFANDWVAKNNSLVQDDIQENWNGDRYCIQNIKLSTVTCYRWVPGGLIGPAPNYYVTEPCSLEDCCKYTLEICKLPNGEVESAQQIDETPIECGEGCFNSCGFFGDYSKKSINESILNNTNVLLSPNPNTGTFNLSINTNTMGKYTIEINNLAGNVLFSKDINIQSENFQTEINLQNETTGTYLMQIKNNKETVYSTKFNVVK